MRASPAWPYLPPCCSPRTVGLVYLTMVRSGVPTILAFIFAFISMVLQAVHLHARPHMFTTLLVAAFAFLLLEARRTQSARRLLLLPPLMAIWGNLHGGFLVGFILLIMFAADAWRRWWRTRDARTTRYAAWITGIVGLCLVASLLTPAGIELWPHTTGYLGETWLIDFTQEYTSPDFHDALLRVFLACFLLGPVVLALLRSPVDLLGLATWITVHGLRPQLGAERSSLCGPCTSMARSMGGRLGPTGPRSGESLHPFHGVGATPCADRVHAARLAGPRHCVSWRSRRQRSMPGRREVYRFSSKAFPVAAVEALLDSDFEPPGTCLQ